MEKKFLLVDSDALPEVFRRVVKAKEYLTTGQAKNITQAAKMVGISRSALYKYKDSVFDVGGKNTVVTLQAKLRDEPGALQSLLSVLSAAGANVVTINQSAPQDGVAPVSIMCRTGGMDRDIEQVLAEISRQRAVVEIRRALQDMSGIME